MTGIYNTVITFYILFPPLIPVAEVHFFSCATAQENAFCHPPGSFSQKGRGKKELVQNEQVKGNAGLLKAKCSRQKKKTVAFCVELKIKAAPFQVEFNCKLWI